MLVLIVVVPKISANSCIQKRLYVEEPEQRIAYLLVMLDEADDFISDCANYGYAPITALKDVQEKMPDRFKFVLAGLHDVVRFNRAAALGDNSGVPHLGALNIKPFTREESRQLLLEPLSYLGISIASDEIIATTNYFPGLIQLYCQKMVESLRSQDYGRYVESQTPPYKVTDDNIGRVLKDGNFLQEIHKKFEMTLRLDRLYFRIAWLIAYMNYMEPQYEGCYTAQDLVEYARNWGMPKLNLRCPAAAAYFTEVALYWLREAGVDGWRLDVGDEISHEFWRSFRKAIKAEFPQALIVGEIWHHAPDFLQGDQWDSVMNYPFYRSVLDFAATGSIPASAFLDALGFQRGNIHTCAYPLLWNLLGSHDTARLLYLCGENRQKQKLAAALQLLLPGMPMIYYGDEIGMTGANDPDCRRGMLWDEARQDKGTLHWYRRLLQLRREEPAIVSGQSVCTEARDEDGLIFIVRKLAGKYVVLLFHAMDNAVSLPALAGKWDLLNERVFDGTLRGIGAMVLTLDEGEFV